MLRTGPYCVGFVYKQPVIQDVYQLIRPMPAGQSSFRRSMSYPARTEMCQHFLDKNTIKVDVDLHIFKSVKIIYS